MLHKLHNTLHEPLPFAARTLPGRVAFPQVPGIRKNFMNSRHADMLAPTGYYH